jgi:GNAT superfamily N-acetyltransferase
VDTDRADFDAVKIRTRHDGDLVELVQVASRVHDVDSYPIFLPNGDYPRFLCRPVPLVAWVATAEDRVVGHVALNATTSPPVMQLVDEQEPAIPAVYVARLLVDPGARGHEIGRRLLEHARCAAVAAGRVPFLDVVDVGTAAPAIGLYRRDGWQEIGRVRFQLAGNDVDELVFRGPVH